MGFAYQQLQMISNSSSSTTNNSISVTS
jgi:hypothetical protein